MPEEVCDTGAVLNNIGGLTNIDEDEDEMPLHKKAKDMARRDLIIIWDRPCRVVRTELLPTGLISFTCMDIFNHRRVTRRLDPDDICEVPLVSRADYLCTGVCDEKDSVILESDDGSTRDDIKMPPSIVLRMQILFGLQKGREVIVTFIFNGVGAYHERHIQPQNLTSSVCELSSCFFLIIFSSFFIFSLRIMCLCYWYV